MEAAPQLHLQRHGGSSVLHLLCPALLRPAVQGRQPVGDQAFHMEQIRNQEPWRARNMIAEKGVPAMAFLLHQAAPRILVTLAALY